MFTGLVEEVGTVERVTPGRQAAILRIRAGVVTRGLAIGDSVAVNGACLTVVAHGAASLVVEAVHETLERSTTGALRAGSRVNLERALAVGGRLGGHIVSGHVDGVGTVEHVEPDGSARRYTVAADPHVMRYVVEKGSIAVDGISLTIASLTPSSFTVSVIPHTSQATTLAERRAGDKVNLETDVIGRYVERLMGLGAAGSPQAQGSPLAQAVSGSQGAQPARDRQPARDARPATSPVDASLLARCGFL